MSLSMVVCVSDNMCIGVNNGLLAHVKPDMKRFVDLTTGHTVMMGKNTYLSLPNLRPLKNRENIIVSRSIYYPINGFQVVSNPWSYIESVKSDESKKVFIIGGAKLYEEFMSVVDTIYMTWLHANQLDLHVASAGGVGGFNVRDKYTFFPDNIYDYEWDIEKEQEGYYLLKNYGLLKYDFLTLHKK